MAVAHKQFRFAAWQPPPPDVQLREIKHFARPLVADDDRISCQ